MSLQEKDASFIWHPFTQEKTAAANIPIVKAKGVWLFKEDGTKILDGISSWWTNILGHANPNIAKAIADQAKTLEHVIFAGFTHPKAVELSERLLGHLGPEYSKIFFSDNGSTANEVALKMAFQYWFNQGTPKNKIIAFDGSYHGDTFGVMSTGGRSAFTDPFEPNLFEVFHLPLPNGQNDQEILEAFEDFAGRGNVAAFAFEPLILGTAGMVMYSPELLKELFVLCERFQVLTIADEVFSGFFRTGKLYAHFHAAVNPDIICTSKGLTGGFMTLGLTICKPFIYDAFYSDDKMKALFHGHSYTGNPIACAAACATLVELGKPEIQHQIQQLMQWQKEWALRLSECSSFEHVRTLGTILAFDVKTGEGNSYFNSIRDRLYHFFLEKDILLRPLGNTLYLVTPFIITKAELDLIYQEILTLNKAIEDGKF